MQLEIVNMKSANLIPSHTTSDGMRIRQSGIAKVLWRKLDTDVPESEVIVGGLDIFKD